MEGLQIRPQPRVEGGIDVHERHVVMAVRKQLGILKADTVTQEFAISKNWMLARIEALNTQTPETPLNISAQDMTLSIQALDRLGTWNDIYGYDDYAMTYQDLFGRIIMRIRSLTEESQTNEAIKTFAESLSSMFDRYQSFVCNTGQVTRALSALHPYYDDLKIAAGYFSRENFDIQIHRFRETLQLQCQALGSTITEVQFSEIKNNLIEAFKQDHKDLYETYQRIFEDYMNHITHDA